jgi:hypothetical protein
VFSYQEANNNGGDIFTPAFPPSFFPFPALCQPVAVFGCSWLPTQDLDINVAGRIV